MTKGVFNQIAAAASQGTATVARALFGRKPGGLVVLGAAVAAARRQEDARLAEGPYGPSPLAGCQYDSERARLNLLGVRALPVDTALRRVARAFREQSREEQHETRARIEMGELYTLVTFARRCAALALNDVCSTWPQDGLSAIAMVDETRIDQRDALSALSLLAHATQATGSNWRALLDDVSGAVTPGMALLLAVVASPSPLTDSGYMEVRHDGVVGFVRWGGASYRPTLDLQALAVRLGAQLEGRDYVPQLEIGVEVPDVWFLDPGGAKQLLRTVHGAVQVSGDSARAPSDRFADMFIQWVAELPGPKETSALVECAGPQRRHDGRFITACAVDRLICLVVAGSWIEGVDPTQTLDSLAPIVNETRVAMEQVAGQSGAS